MKINRRDFIKTGGMVMLGSLAAPSFLGSCTGTVSYTHLTLPTIA